MRKVASENRLVKRKSEGPDKMGHIQERHSSQRWNDFETHATLDNPWVLSHTCRSSRVRCAREKCACGEVFSVHHRRIHACWLLPERGICRKKSARLHWKAGLSGWSGLHRFPCCYFHFFETLIPPILVLPPMRVPFLPLMLQDDELHHVGLYDQLEDDDAGCWRSEFFGCTEYSAQWKLGPF